MNFFWDITTVDRVVRIPPGGRQGFVRGFLAALFFLGGGRAWSAPGGGEEERGGGARAEMRMLGGRPDFRGEDLPPGRLRERVEGLPGPARARAEGWFQSFSFPEPDVASIGVDEEGGVFYVCEFPVPEEGAGEMGDGEVELMFTASGPLPVSPFPEELKFSSRPGAPNVIFLDFDGAVVSGTAWNNVVGRDPIVARAFSADTNEAFFSEVEQARIFEVWLRVAEDFAPFHVNVTTEEPAVWNNRVAHVLITQNRDAGGELNPYSSAGGVAYVNVFNASNYSFYRPAWVYADNLSFNASFIAEAASHEAGHNLGLSHDGLTTGEEYYRGHGSGETSWGPIMGASYNRNVSQWSRGEYYLANNTQDDLAILAGKLGYRASDHGGTLASASFVQLSEGTNVVSVSPQSDPGETNRVNRGVIERNTDVDMFSFTTGSGPVFFRALPWVHPTGPRGNNLDVRLRLLDGSGQVLGESNPAGQTGAELSLGLVEGVYYLEVSPSGTGNPLGASPTGYTVYGSLGAYFLSGWVTDPSGLVIPPQAELTVSDLVTPGVGRLFVYVTYSDNVAIDVSTLGTGNVVVKGPGGFEVEPELVSFSPSGNGSPRVAVYGLDAPDGVAWRPADNGVYTVEMRGESVFDVEGASVAPQVLGEFSCAVPSVFYEALMNVNPGWTLSGQWAYGAASGSGGNPPSGFTGTHVIGYNLSGGYGRNLALTYATTPTITVNGAQSLFLQYYRWLGVRAQATANVQISVNGGAWQTVWQNSGTITDTSWAFVQHDVTPWAQGASTIRLRWGMGSGPQGVTSFGWNLDDVRVVGTVADAAPPTATLQANALTVAGAPYHEISVLFADHDAVAVSTLGDGNLEVLTPFGGTAVVFYVGTDLPGNGSPRLATYRIAPLNGAWSAAFNGIYEVWLNDGQVGDVSGNVMERQGLGTFEVAIPESTGQRTLRVVVNDARLGRVDVPEVSSYPEGSQVVLSALPVAEAGVFAEWSGDVVSDGNPLVVTLNGDLEVMAVFSAVTAGEFGTPVWWLMEQGITNDFDVAVLEAGANGFPLWASYVAGLNPGDASSVLAMTPVGGADGFGGGGGLVLSWPTVTGRVYTVVHAADFKGGFVPLSGAVDLPWTQTSYTAETEQAQGGFGVKVRQED